MRTVAAVGGGRFTQQLGAVENLETYLGRRARRLGPAPSAATPRHGPAGFRLAAFGATVEAIGSILGFGHHGGGSGVEMVGFLQPPQPAGGL